MTWTPNTPDPIPMGVSAYRTCPQNSHFGRMFSGSLSSCRAWWPLQFRHCISKSWNCGSWLKILSSHLNKNLLPKNTGPRCLQMIRWNAIPNMLMREKATCSLKSMHKKSKKAHSTDFLGERSKQAKNSSRLKRKNGAENKMEKRSLLLFCPFLHETQL